MFGSSFFASALLAIIYLLEELDHDLIGTKADHLDSIRDFYKDRLC